MRQVSGKCVHQLWGTQTVMHASRHTGINTHTVQWAVTDSVFIGVSGYRLMVYIQGNKTHTHTHIHIYKLLKCRLRCARVNDGELPTRDGGTNNNAAVDTDN